ncbi:DUF4373 domain-containing protein [Dysgonomonas macrotermitis]|uniref:Lin1244/Lin1753-like N-terminal domain-containing protein n=1 Tax=Dysgonomonas macrotermitis TaxID=1346286 RepID=A0A1M5C5Y7_9BACT|nr:DUF4373 domain-containing protein [Dysgonomonas macrotermitis]SHF50184.1 protein of unknown function [Dysgonomonas macrotermitis]
MARPLKRGLDYFPFDIDFFEDEKIGAISGEFGIKGEIATIKLLCAVYRNGYFLQWNEMLKMKLLKNLPGVSAELIDQIVSRLVKWGFYDQSLFDSDKILTSVGIQTRYFEAIKRRKTNEVFPYLLVNVCNNGINDNNNSITADNNTQSKGNNSTVIEKEKLSIESKKKAEELKRLDQETKAKEQIKKANAAKAATEKRKDEFYQSLVPYVPRYGKDMIRAFFNFWSEPNRTQTKMKFELQKTWDLALRLGTWNNREPIYGKTAKEIQQPAGPSVVD